MSGTPTDPGIMPRSIDVLFNSIKDFRAVKHVFKPDRMNGFDSQSKAEAMAERQKEMNVYLSKTPRRGGNGGGLGSRPGTAESESEQRNHDSTVLPISNQDSVYAVFITYVEIYNNFVYDLLDESPIEMHKKATLQTKMLREDANHNIYVNGVTEVEVESSEEALDIYQRGQKRRRMAHTALNTESSRSHSIFNIRLVQVSTSFKF
jgi:kinesin family protein 23